MANIAEGFDRNRDNEFHQVLSISKGSCAEVSSHHYSAYDVGHLTDEALQRLNADSEEVSRLVAGLGAAVDRRRTQH